MTYQEGLTSVVEVVDEPAVALEVAAEEAAEELAPLPDPAS